MIDVYGRLSCSREFRFHNDLFMILHWLSLQWSWMTLPKYILFLLNFHLDVDLKYWVKSVTKVTSTTSELWSCGEGYSFYSNIFLQVACLFAAVFLICFKCVPSGIWILVVLISFLQRFFLNPFKCVPGGIWILVLISF